MKKDKINLHRVLCTAMPGSLICEVENFDDFNYGYSVCPTPGVLIELKMPMYWETIEGMEIRIDKWVTRTLTNEVTHTRIYRGPIKLMDESRAVDTLEEIARFIDLDFLSHLLSNWNCFRS